MPFDPLMPNLPILNWIYKQEPYIAFSAGKGPRLMHLYTEGTSLVDIKEVSRLLYIDYDTDHARRNPQKTTIYFEFDQWDSRYNTISSMLIYFINTIVWHFWDEDHKEVLPHELKFLSDIRGWSPEDLYHIYYGLRRGLTTRQVTLFLSCFDQCPEKQWRWFIERVIEGHSHREKEYRLILSSSTRDGLAVENFPDASRINIDKCLAIDSLTKKFATNLEKGLIDLLEKRPIYRECSQNIEALLRECEDAPYLGLIILTWLRNSFHGWPTSEIAFKISALSPPTAENIVRIIVSSLTPELRVRTENIFNWVKHAMEPWSTESIAEALAVCHFPD